MSGRIIHLHGDPHREVLELLPWYVTGQLDAADLHAVESHLEVCASCRAALATERCLDREIVRVPTGVDAGWADMRQRLDLDHAPVSAATPRHRGYSRETGARSIWSGPLGWRPGWPAGILVRWQTGIPLAFASLAALFLLVPPDAAPQFKTLSTTAVPNETYVVVKFRPDTSEAVFRQTLQASDARLVDGPTAASAYVLAVPASTRIAVLERLRQQPQVVLAQPIDASGRP